MDNKERKSSAAKLKAQKKYDNEHFKQYTVKFKIDEFNRLEKASTVSGLPKNTLLRKAVNTYVDNILNDKADSD